MTTTTTTSRVSYTGDGATTAFSLSTMTIQAATHLAVYYLVSGGSSSTLWVKDVDYTVNAALTSITATVAPAASSTLTIIRAVPLTQTTDLKDNSAAKAEVTETALDKLTMMVQQLDEAIDRSLVLDPTSSSSALALPAPSANKLLGWNAGATALENKVVADIDTIVLPASGICAADGSSTLLGRTITGTSAEITVTNGTGVSGNPTLSLPTALTFTGKTVTGGTFTGITDITVADGGTGVSTMTTAYAPVCAGTTATGALQVASTGLGTAGYVFTTNGSAALPSFQALSVGVVQIKATSVADGITGTTSIPWDDTIPQNTEGDEVLTLAITPTNANNKLLIEFAGFGGGDNSGAKILVALFQDTTAGALSATAFDVENTGTTHAIFLRHVMTAGTTSATTFKIRVGFSTAGSAWWLNKADSANLFSTIPSSVLTITEIKV